MLCENKGLHIHLTAELLGGGDALSRLQRAARRLAIHETRGQFAGKYALLDTDQRALSQDRAEEADRLADALNVAVIWQDPCHEAFLAKHFVGANRRPQTAADALAYLQEFWPEFYKAMTARKLSARITLEGVLCAGKVNPALEDLLRTIGLLEDEAQQSNP